MQISREMVAWLVRRQYDHVPWCNAVRKIKHFSEVVHKPLAPDPRLVPCSRLMRVGGAFGCAIVLGGFPPIAHGIVTHNADVAYTVRVREQQSLPVLEISHGVAIRPDEHEA